jgi:hypothetical protein
MEALKEGIRVAEIVRIIRIPHEDVSSPRCVDTASESAAIAFAPNMHHAGAMSASDLRGAVRAPVIGDDHLAIKLQALKSPQSFVDASPNSTGLIQAGHDHREIELSVTRQGRLRTAEATCQVHGRAPRLDTGD